MTAPSVESLTATPFSSSATAHLVNMPASVTAGWLLLMGFGFSPDTTVTTPSGWSIVAAKITDTATQIVYGKVADGTEGGTTVDVVTGVARPAAAQVYAISGWGGTLATNVVSGGGNTSGGTPTNAPDPPEVSWTWGALDELFIVFAHATATSTFTAAPTNYTDLTTTQAASAGSANWMASARRAVTADASPEDPGTFTLSATELWVANTIAVKPASKAPPVFSRPWRIWTARSVR